VAIAGITWARIVAIPDPFCRITFSEFLARVTLSSSFLFRLKGTGIDPLKILLKIRLTKGKNDFGAKFSCRAPPFCETFRRILLCPFISRWRFAGICLGAIFTKWPVVLLFIVQR